MQSNAWQRRAGGLVHNTLSAHARVPAFWTAEQRIEFFSAEIEQNARLLSEANLVEVPQRIGTPYGHRVQLRLAAARREFLGKLLSPTDALKAQAASLLANICGVPNPTVVAGTWHGHSLAVMPLVTNFEHVDQELAVAACGSDTVVETLLASRCFNECVWNLDCWRGNFIVPIGATAEGKIRELVNIDFDDCLVSRRAEWLMRVLRNNYGVTDRLLAECRWSEGQLCLESPLHYDTTLLDSAWTIFGTTWPDLLRRLDGHTVEKLEILSFEGVSQQGFEKIWEPYIDHCWDQFRGVIPLQASQEWLVPDEFLERLFRRFSLAPRQILGVVEEARRKIHPMELGYRDQG